LCISPSTAVTINAAPLTPVIPNASVTVQPTCSLPKGTILITAPTGTNLQYSIDGINYQSSTTFSGLNPGTYNIVARYAGFTCISGVKSLTVNPVNLSLCGDDIYFPSAFTPNGDGNNDGFGPGPLSNLINVTEYSLSIYNRYGEKVFSTNDPYQKWDGTFKGLLLANYNYVWQASYKKAGGIKKFKKGSITIVK
jgi:gliding motility-associated-like protein